MWPVNPAVLWKRKARFPQGLGRRTERAAHRINGIILFEKGPDLKRLFQKGGRNFRNPSLGSFTLSSVPLLIRLAASGLAT
jgi:hypothetical protein